MFQEEKLRELFNPQKYHPVLRRVLGGEPPKKPLLNASGEEIYHPGNQHSVRGLYWISDTNLLTLSGSELCSWNPRTGEQLHRIELSGLIATQLLMLPDHRSVLLLTNAREIVWSDLDGIILHSFSAPGDGVMVLSRDGAHLFLQRKEEIIAWSLESRAQLWKKTLEARSLSAEHGIVTVFLRDKIEQYQISSGALQAQYTPPGKESILRGYMLPGGKAALLARYETNTYLDSYAPREDVIFCYSNGHWERQSCGSYIGRAPPSTRSTPPSCLREEGGA